MAQCYGDFGHQKAGGFDLHPTELVPDHVDNKPAWTAGKAGEPKILAT
jgi:hypothetical protein